MSVHSGLPRLEEARVCLITTGQPSTNPRLVKEADALAEAGCDVHVVGAHRAPWADLADQRLLASRPWRVTLVDWREEVSPALFRKSRVRHWAARTLTSFPMTSRGLATAALSRVGPELQKAAMPVHADLYVAHNLGALPVACSVAAAHSASIGFDAEDFHSGQLSGTEERKEAEFTRRVEKRFLPRCAYVTAAAPGIAEAYRDLCDIPLPSCVLNVSPLDDRPARFRPGDSASPVRLYWFSQTIGPDRGLEEIVRAMGVLQGNAIELHLRGNWTPGYEQTLRAIAADSGLSQHLIVSHDVADQDEMVRLAAAYDIGLALEPSADVNNDMALSNKIFTYLLAGNAVLATRTSGQFGLSNDIGGAAAWCEPRDPESLASALRPWIEHRNALGAARETAWRLGETRFNWDREKTIFLEQVGRVLGKREWSRR